MEAFGHPWNKYAINQQIALMPLTFKQFLTEKISTSGLGRTITRKIWAELPKESEKFYEKTIKQFSFYVYKKDPDTNIAKDQREKDRELVSKWLEQYLRDIFETVGNEFFKNWEHRRNGVKVWFEKIKDKHNGEWWRNTRNIFINRKFLDTLTNQFVEDFSQAFLDSGYDEQVRLDLPSGADSTLEQIIEIFVHEITHAHQDYRVKKDNVQTTYSYLIKNKKKYYEMIDKEIGEHWEAYLANPKEIEAFAQELVHRMLKHSNLDEPEYEMLAIKDFLDDFEASVKWDSGYYEKFKGSDKRVFIKTRQRFLKKVYKELHQRYDDIKKEVEENRKKEEERQKRLKMDLE